MSNNPLREEILRRIDLIAEFQKHGGRVGTYLSPDGWQSVRSIDREDEHPSAAINVSNDPNKRGIYVDYAATGKGSRSYFDMLS